MSSLARAVPANDLMRISMVSHLNEWPELGTNRGALNVRKWVVEVEGERIRVRPPGAIHLMSWRSHKRTIVNGWIPWVCLSSIGSNSRCP